MEKGKTGRGNGRWRVRKSVEPLLRTLALKLTASHREESPRLLGDPLSHSFPLRMLWVEGHIHSSRLSQERRKQVVQARGSLIQGNRGFKNCLKGLENSWKEAKSKKSSCWFSGKSWNPVGSPVCRRKQLFAGALTDTAASLLFDSCPSIFLPLQENTSSFLYIFWELHSVAECKPQAQEVGKCPSASGKAAEEYATDKDTGLFSNFAFYS